MLRRKKKQQDEGRSEKKKILERDRLQKAEEAYLERLTDSIREGNVYVTRPKSPYAAPAPPAPGAEEQPVYPVHPLPPGPPRPQQPAGRRDPPPAPQSPTPLEGLTGIPQSTLERVIKPPSGGSTHSTTPSPVSPPRPPAPPAAAGPPPVPAPPPVPPVAPPVAPPAPPEPPAAPRVASAPPAAASTGPIGTFPRGTILQLEDGTVAIYKDPVKGKEYEVVYALRASGRLHPEGIALYAYEAKKIGRLPDDLFEEFQKTLRWDRDAVCFHLDKYEHCSLIPLSERPVSVAGATGGEAKDSSKGGVKPDPPTTRLIDPARELVRGRRVYISFGPGKTWEAVYWGKDLLGHVVAHRTHNEWALMHLNIKRFRDSIEVGEILRDDDIKAIQQDILKSQERYENQ